MCCAPHHRSAIERKVDLLVKGLEWYSIFIAAVVVSLLNEGRWFFTVTFMRTIGRQGDLT